MSRVDKLYKALNQIIEDEAKVINFKRVYIDKPNGGRRPLGVPAPE